MPHVIAWGDDRGWLVVQVLASGLVRARRFPLPCRRQHAQTWREHGVVDGDRCRKVAAEPRVAQASIDPLEGTQQRDPLEGGDLFWLGIQVACEEQAWQFCEPATMSVAQRVLTPHRESIGALRSEFSRK